MSDARRIVSVGMAGGAVWAGGTLWLGYRMPASGTPLWLGFLAPGLVLAAMIGNLARRRFFALSLIEGTPPPPGSPADLDRRVLANTVEQTLLALCLWPALAMLLGPRGPGMMMVLDFSFAVTRLIFWAGYRRNPLLRGFGFAAGFYSTLLARFWAVWLLVAGP